MEDGAPPEETLLAGEDPAGKYLSAWGDGIYKIFVLLSAMMEGSPTMTWKDDSCVLRYWIIAKC